MQRVHARGITDEQWSRIRRGRDARTGETPILVFFETHAEVMYLRK